MYKSTKVGQSTKGSGNGMAFKMTGGGYGMQRRGLRGSEGPDNSLHYMTALGD